MVDTSFGNAMPNLSNSLGRRRHRQVSWVGSSSLVIHMKLTRVDDAADVLKALVVVDRWGAKQWFAVDGAVKSWHSSPKGRAMKLLHTCHMSSK